MSGSPERWVDDPDAPQALRRDLRVAQEVPPYRYDVGVGLAQFRAAIGSSGAASGATAQAGNAAAKAANKGLLAKGWTWILLALPVVTAVGMWGWRIGTDAPQPSASKGHHGAGSPHSAERSVPPRSNVAPAPSPDPHGRDRPAATPPSMGNKHAPAAKSTASVKEGPAERRPDAKGPDAPTGGEAASAPGKTDRAPSDVKTRSPAAPATDEDGQLQREIAQLARARRWLEPAPKKALALVERGQREFPDGMFVEEREAIAVFALARLGRDAEAARRAEAFLQQYPDAPVRGRIEQIAGGARAAIDDGPDDSGSRSP